MAIRRATGSRVECKAEMAQTKDRASGGQVEEETWQRECSMRLLKINETRTRNLAEVGSEYVTTGLNSLVDADFEYSCTLDYKLRAKRS